MRRFLPAIASLLGGVGLGLACGYLVLIVHAFSPEGQGAVEFLVGASDQKLSFGFAVVLVPYVLLMGHLWMRIRVGGWLADAGEFDRARKYSSRRIKHGIFRARKEALANRTVLIRVAAVEQDYVEALRLVETSEALAEKTNSFTVAFRRWAAEVQLRSDNLVAVKRHRDKVGVPKERSTEAAGFCAAMAELAVREGDEASASEWIERADFAAADLPRTSFARALLGGRFATVDEGRRSALSALDAAAAWLEQMPGARGEALSTRTNLLRALGNEEEAVALLRAGVPTSDRRSKFLVEQTMATFEGMGDAAPEEE